PTATRRGTKNSSPVRAQPIPRCPAKIYPCRLVSLSVYQTGWTRLVDAHLCGGILAANDSAQWLNGVAPALMSGSHLHLFWLQGSTKRLRQVVFFGCSIPARTTPKWSRFCEAEFTRCHGTRKIFPVYG